MLTRRLLYCFSILSILILGDSCASKRTQFRNTQDEKTPLSTDTSNYRSVYMLGNLGADKKGPNASLLKAFTSFQKEQAQEDDYLMILGDNVYANKLEQENNKSQLQEIISLIEDFKGETLIIPGENDWNDHGVDGLEKIEDFIEKQMHFYN